MRALFAAGVLFLLIGLCFARHTESEVGTQRLSVDIVFRSIQQTFRARLPTGSGSQFAVLALIPDSLTNANDLMGLFATTNEGTFYSFSRPTFLPGDNFRTHAEVLVLDDRAKLIQNYRNSAYGRAGTAYTPLLYTWIHPCGGCTGTIIESAQGFSPRLANVGYTTQGTALRPPLTDDDRRIIRNSLQIVKITLTQIPSLIKMEELEEEEAGQLDNF
eukprot:Em0001g310a